MTILVPWDKGSAEDKAFLAVIRPFDQKHGIVVNPESTRALTQDLDADIAAGDPPDLADLPSPAAVYQYKEQRSLKPLTIDLSSYAQPWLTLAEAGTATTYAIPVKADIKSLIWYNTRVLRSPPKSWAALMNLSQHGTPWCLGLASGSTSGWPGADWVAQILLSTYPTAKYESWLDGGLQWKSAQVSNAWTTWGDFMRSGDAIDGRALGAVGKGFRAEAGDMSSGQCELEHGALSATGLIPTAGYDYVPFPSISGAVSPILVSGDFMGLFTDNPNAENLLAYLASPQAQMLWERQGGYAFSADQAVKPAAYLTKVQQRIAGLFQRTDKTMLCFSAEDMMLPDMSNTFEQAVLVFIVEPGLLPTLLADLQTTQNEVHAAPSWLAKHACAQP